MEEELKENVVKDIQWHPAFVSAMNLELLENRQVSVRKSGEGICAIYSGSVYGSKRKVDRKMERRGWNGSGINEDYGA